MLYLKYQKQQNSLRMKTLLGIFFTIYCSLTSLAQCDIPYQFSGNTGANMTIMLVPDFINSLPITLENSYIVAFNSNGQTVGSTAVSNLYQTTLAVWGDDSTTGAIDGALSGELISFQLIDGESVYTVIMPTIVSYTTNGLIAQTSAAVVTPFCIYGCTSNWAENFNVQATNDDGTCFLNGCTDELACNYTPSSTIDNGTCIQPGCTNTSYIEYYHQAYTAGCDDGSCATETSDLGIESSYFISPSNTGANMTLGINLNNTTGLEGSTIAAFCDLNNDGLTTECVGLSEFQEGFFSMALWGNDQVTNEIDGLQDGEMDIIFAVLNESGSVMAFNINPAFIGYTTNGIVVITSFDFDVTIYGCMNDSYCNYDLAAEEEDGSCFGTPGCINNHYVEYNSDVACNLDGACITTWENAFLNEVEVSNELEQNLTESNQTNSNLQNELTETITNANQAQADATTLLNNTIDAADIAEMNANQAQEDATTLLNNIIDAAEIAAVNAQNELDETIANSNQAQAEATTLLNNTINAADLAEVNAQNELDETIVNANQAQEDATTLLNNTIDAADLAAVDAQNELDETIANSNEAQADATTLLNNTISNFDVLELNYQYEIEGLSAPILIDIIEGWNIIGYTNSNNQDIVATLEDISDHISIVKDNNANVYWPEFGFNGIGDLIPGQGYQLKIDISIDNYFFPDTQGERINISPTIPQWVIDLPAEVHPNDIRTLVKVVNLLGQEVKPNDSARGTTLIYLFNDGTVEKKIK